MLDKNLRSIIAIAVIAIAASAVYYYAFYLPKIDAEKVAQNQQQVLLGDQQKCSADGTSYFQNYLTANNVSGYSWDTPEYHYSGKLNTCLAYIRYVSQFGISAGKSNQFDQVIDVYSNKTILYGWFERDTSVTPWKETLISTGDVSVPNYTSDQFFTTKNSLFSE